MLLPVLALYVTKLEHATPFLIGIALGVYALTQAIFQIPMGRLSDKFGRKPIIAIGLLIFILGSALAAMTQNIFFIIAGRALQGSGAISSAALAMAADLSRDAQRTKVMAIVGVSIGLAFSAAFVLGPIIDGQFGLSGVFTVVAGLGVAALAVLFMLVPKSEQSINDTVIPISQTASAEVARDSSVVNILGGFFLHAILAISFVVIPLHLAVELALPSARHYQIYLPVILVSLLFVAPLVMLSTRSGRQKSFIRMTIAALGIGLGLIPFFPATHTITYLALGIFFIGFNYLEAALPSQVSKESDAKKRGQTMGSYATLQFLGTFLGAMLGGLVLDLSNNTSVILTAVGIAGLWLLLSVATTKPNSSAGDSNKS